MKVLENRFHLNGHTIGFHPQTQKLVLHYMSPQLTLGVKGLNLSHQESPYVREKMWFYLLSQPFEAVIEILKCDNSN